MLNLHKWCHWSTFSYTLDFGTCCSGCMNVCVWTGTCDLTVKHWQWSIIITLEKLYINTVHLCSDIVLHWFLSFCQIWLMPGCNIIFLGCENKCSLKVWNHHTITKSVKQITRNLTQHWVHETISNKESAHWHFFLISNI